jgi:hypothetical protein
VLQRPVNGRDDQHWFEFALLFSDRPVDGNHIVMEKHYSNRVMERTDGLGKAGEVRDLPWFPEFQSSTHTRLPLTVAV